MPGPPWDHYRSRLVIFHRYKWVESAVAIIFAAFYVHRLRIIRRSIAGIMDEADKKC